MRPSCGNLFILLLAGAALAQTAQKPPAEPGEAESRQRRTTATLPTTFTSPAVEARGIWLASRDMLLPRKELSKLLDQLKAANFNIVLIDTQFRGYVAYPGSEILPQFPDFKGEDVLGWLIDQCHQREMQAYLWMEYGFYAYFTPDASKDKSMGKILDEHPDLLSVDSDGTKFIHRSFGDFYSTCPSNPRSHEILAKLYAEAIRKYPAADGINLDRIRYAAGNYCYCNYCREHFPKETGIELEKFEPDSPHAKKFLEWKRERTLKAVATIVHAIHTVRPGLPITSYVVGPDEMDDTAQAWDLWINRGLLDGVAVSMYGAEIRVAAVSAILLLKENRHKMICAISCGQETPIYITNVEMARGLGGFGQYTWHFGDVFDDLEALKAGPYANPATPPGTAEPARRGY